MRNQIYTVTVTGDLEKAFLPVRIREAERDALRFHWKPPGQSSIEVYQFTQALCGLTSCPFLLDVVINQHLTLRADRYPEFVDEICKSLYVDDLLSGGGGEQLSEAQTKPLKVKAFNLHKWHNNESELEINYAHQQPIQELTLHAFGDASGKGISSVVCCGEARRWRSAEYCDSQVTCSQTSTNNTKIRTGGRPHGC